MKQIDVALVKRVDLAISVGGGAAPAPDLPIIELTQAQYDALDFPDENTLYAIPKEVT